MSSPISRCAAAKPPRSHHREQLLLARERVDGGSVAYSISRTIHHDTSSTSQRLDIFGCGCFCISNKSDALVSNKDIDIDNGDWM